MPRRKADPFAPLPGQTFSKSRVNDAGRQLAALKARAIRDGDKAFHDVDVVELTHWFRAVEWWRHEHAAPLSAVAQKLRYHVRAENGFVDGRIDVTQRLKRFPTIIDKLEREPKMRLARMADIGGVRARLPDPSCVAAVSRRLKKTWTIERTRDYITHPKPSGYRAIHHVVRHKGVLVEVQLRTVLQDAWANQVELDGRAQGIDFKFGLGEDEVHEYYSVMAEAFACLDAGEGISSRLRERLLTAHGAVAGRLGR